MIHHLDELLQHLFVNNITEISAMGQVRFQAPDQDWRSLIGTITNASGVLANSLNVYLVDLRENRKLRTNERERVTVDQQVFERPPPRRVDCHYLISAWSPTTATAGLDPTAEEHALLAEVARVLGEHDELDPVAIFGASNPPIAPPALIAEERFPVTMLPVEGFPKYAEFWGTMGDRNRWKPCVYTVITVALREPLMPAGPMVTTTFTHTLQQSVAASANTLFHIGGAVLDNNIPRQPIAGAWIELLTPLNERRQYTRADSRGRFVFGDVAPGAWRLRASAMPLGISAPRDITVPEPSGSYDVRF